MAYFDRKDAGESQIFSPLVNTLRTIFGRSAQQMARIKGQDTEQEPYNRPDSIEKTLAKIFTGYADIQYDRVTKYRDYDRMDQASTECQTALDMYAEEASQPDSKTGLRVWIESEDKKVAEELNGMFQRIRMEAKAWGLYRNMAKYGDCFEYLLLGTYGVHDLQFIHPSRCERVQEDGLMGFKSPDLSGVVPMDNKDKMFKPWEFIHFRVMAYDQESVYGRSFLESLRKVWKQLSMLETMIVIFRISKAVQRNIFYVDVGQASVQETAELVKKYEQFLKTKAQFVDPVTKDFKLDYNPATLLQDIVWPVRPNSLSKVDKLENTANIGPLTDLEAFRTKMRIGLGIPKDFFDGEITGAWNSKEALILQDARFSRKIQRLQDAMRDGLIKLCQIHWAITHQVYLEPQLFQVKLGTISDSAERIREDILLRKAQILEILAGIGVTMRWNSEVWGDYLLDEIFPLPKALRAKLNTPDPKDQLAMENELKMRKAAGGPGKPGGGATGKAKPPKKSTADNLRMGLRSFGAKREDIEDELKPDLLEEFTEEVTELIEEETKPLIEQIKLVTNKVEIDNLLTEHVSKDKEGNTIIKENKPNKEKWNRFFELGMPPGSIDESTGYSVENPNHKSDLNNLFD